MRREAARRGLPAVGFAPGSNGANDYAALALEVRADDAASLAEAGIEADSDTVPDHADEPAAPAA